LKKRLVAEQRLRQIAGLSKSARKSKLKKRRCSKGLRSLLAGARKLRQPGVWLTTRRGG
jgi:hypothetical protein